MSMEYIKIGCGGFLRGEFNSLCHEYRIDSNAKLGMHFGVTSQRAQQVIKSKKVSVEIYKYLRAEALIKKISSSDYAPSSKEVIKRYNKDILVTNFGKVLREKTILFGDRIISVLSEIPQLSSGYQRVTYTDRSGKRVTEYTHRVVAEVFIPNERNHPQVNHKDGDKSNNNPANLEWCSAGDNIDHAIHILKTHAASMNMKTWLLASPLGEEIVVTNLASWCRENGMDRGGFSQVAMGNAKTTQGGWRISLYSPPNM